jgi:hypothetical protein
MDKMVLLKYAAVFTLIAFVSFIVLGLVFEVKVLTVLGLLLFAADVGLLTFYLVSTQA